MEPSTQHVSCKIVPLTPVNVMIYEYGARLDKDCEAAVHEQLFKAHTLYNEIVACMQQVQRDVSDVLLVAAGERAAELNGLIQGADDQFKAARAADDRDLMTSIAATRREQRRELWSLISSARKHVVEALKPLYAQVGRNAKCATYQLRSKAVAEGLGWATANAVLDAALSAWKKTIKRGQAPRFARFADKTQQSLVLQFTKAGGIRSDELLAGKHREFTLKAPARAAPRQYGEFSFRLGAAAAKTVATGTWQYHRALPDQSSVGLVRLVVRRHANRIRYALQMMVKLPEPVRSAVPVSRSDLVALHMGWANDVSGRRIAGVVSGADPGMAELMRLPLDIEADLDRAAELQGSRDDARNAVVGMVKALPVTDSLAQTLQEEFAVLRRLKPEYIPPRRMYRLIRMLADDETLPEAALTLREDLTKWRGLDRQLWQAIDGIAGRARNRRRDFYRNQAKALVDANAMIAITSLDLQAAALRVNEETGEKSDFRAAARRGRVVAALSEFTEALKWMCTKTRTPLVEVAGEVVAICAYCGGATTPSTDDWHLLQCASCGASVDRKLAGAARVWQIVAPQRLQLQAEFDHHQETTWLDAVDAAEERKRKMAGASAEARVQRSKNEDQCKP